MATPGEAFPQKCEKFVLGVEMRLDPAIYFFDGAFDFPRYARSDVSKLNYKSSPHDQSRIREFRNKFVDISWRSRGFFVAPAQGVGSWNSRSGRGK